MKPFLDTNVLIYAIVEDRRTQIARDALAAGGIISVQSLNEVAAVGRRKLGLSFDEITIAIESILVFCANPLSITYETHMAGRGIAERYRLAIYDSMLLAAALSAGCDIFLSEDMQPGLCIENRLCIENPFHAQNPR